MSNKPLYCFTFHGMLLGISGIYMGARFLQNFTIGRGLNFGPTMLMVLLIVVGIFMALTGILLHSVSAIMKDARST
ncbi:MAG: hypothetical protein WB014_13000 [Methanosarcina sp.]